MALKRNLLSVKLRLQLFFNFIVHKYAKPVLSTCYLVILRDIINNLLKKWVRHAVLRMYFPLETR